MVCKILDILTFSQYKCLCYQIWPWPKIDQGHPRVIIWINYDGTESPMLHTKVRGNRPSGSREEDFWRVFIIYGHGGHLGHVTWTPWTNFRSPIPWRLRMKFGFNRPSGFGEEDVHILWSKGGGACPRGTPWGLLIWAWRPSWSCDLDSTNKLSFPHPMEAPHEIWLQSAQRFWRRRRLKMLTDRHTDNSLAIW